MIVAGETPIFGRQLSLDPDGKLLATRANLGRNCTSTAARLGAKGPGHRWKKLVPLQRIVLLSCT
jgi:hypothetical protein